MSFTLLERLNVDVGSKGNDAVGINLRVRVVVVLLDIYKSSY